MNAERCIFVFVFEFTSGFSLSHGKIERDTMDRQTHWPHTSFAPPDENEGSAELHGFSLLQFP